MQRGSARRRSYAVTLTCRRKMVAAATQTILVLAISCTARATPQGSCALPTLQPPAIHAAFIARPLSVQRRSGEFDEIAVRGRCRQSCVSDRCAGVCTNDSPAAPANPTSTVPVPSTKRVTCLATTQSLKGQDKRDQMQLCMAQARRRLPEAGDRSESGRRDQEEFHQDLRGRGWCGAAIAARPRPYGCGFGAPGNAAAARRRAWRRLLQVHAPVLQFVERNARVGDRAAHEGPRRDHAEIAVEILHLRFAMARGAELVQHGRKSPWKAAPWKTLEGTMCWTDVA